jgi:orotate phosphoribosyltransferase
VGYPPPRPSVYRRSVPDEHLLELAGRPPVLQRLDEPVQLASGQLSRYFVDGKLAVTDPDDFEFVGGAMCAAAANAGAVFDAVGGLVLGAVPFTFAVAQSARCRWFLVRKEPKGRGTDRWIEGARLAAGARVMLVDDVITTGGSIRQAYERVREEGWEVTFATTLVDRGDEATAFFAGEGVPYVPLLSYVDLGIPRVGDEAA